MLSIGDGGLRALVGAEASAAALGGAADEAKRINMARSAAALRTEEAAASAEAASELGRGPAVPPPPPEEADAGAAAAPSVFRPPHEPGVPTCGLCGAAAPHRCARCKATSYCSREHQTQHWKVHKRECRMLRSMLANESLAAASAAAESAAEAADGNDTAGARAADAIVASALGDSDSEESLARILAFWRGELKPDEEAALRETGRLSEDAQYAAALLHVKKNFGDAGFQIPNGQKQKVIAVARRLAVAQLEGERYADATQKSALEQLVGEKGAK